MLNLNSCYENIKAIDKAYISVGKEAQVFSRSSTSVLDSFEKQNNFIRKKSNSGFLSAFFDLISFEREHVKKMFRMLKNNATNLPSWFQTLSGKPHNTLHLSKHFNAQAFDQSV